MIFVPVIDLKDGVVVRARGGARDRYLPVISQLCADSEPVNVVKGYLRLYPFTTLYVADLDAIEGKGDNAHVIRRLIDLFPGLELWVDCGLTGREDCLMWMASTPGHLVLGSESQRNDRTLTGLLSSAHARRLILSLDFRAETFLGPAGLASRPDLWPDRIISMTLSRIGGSHGPDAERLTQLTALAPEKQFFAAGGIRDIRDLAHLAALGARGVLLASALHDGSIGRADLERVATA